MIQTPSHTLAVTAIKNGTVIDHITAGQGLKIIRLLHLASEQKLVTVGLNLPSRAMGHKDLIKVEERELSQDEADQVAILAPDASINIIKNYKVVKKFHVKLPEMIERVIVCPNPLCITNHEKMSTSFFVSTFKKEMRLRCKYCEKIFSQEDIAHLHA